MHLSKHLALRLAQPCACVVNFLSEGSIKYLLINYLLFELLVHGCQYRCAILFISFHFLVEFFFSHLAEVVVLLESFLLYLLLMLTLLGEVLQNHRLVGLQRSQNVTDFQVIQYNEKQFYSAHLKGSLTCQS